MPLKKSNAEISNARHTNVQSNRFNAIPINAETSQTLPLP